MISTSWLSSVVDFFTGSTCDDCDDCGCECSAEPEVTCVIYIKSGDPVEISRPIEDPENPYAEFEPFLQWFARNARSSADAVHKFRLADGYYVIRHSDIIRIHVYADDTWVNE